MLPASNRCIRFLAVSGDGQSTHEHNSVDVDTFAQRFEINDANLASAISESAADVAVLSAWVAYARRAWQVAERHLREWKAGQTVEIVATSEKKPAEHVIEAMIRLKPEYAVLNVAAEEAEESYHVAEGLLDAARSRKDLLARFARVSGDGARLQI